MQKMVSAFCLLPSLAMLALLTESRSHKWILIMLVQALVLEDSLAIGLALCIPRLSV